MRVARRTGVLLVLALACVAALVWFAFFRVGEDAATSASGLWEPSPRGPAAGEVVASRSGAPAPAPDAARPDPSVDGPSQPPGASDASEVVVNVRVVFDDANRGPAKFRFSWLSADIRAAASGTVEGADGLSRATFPAPGRYRLTDFHADGQARMDAEKTIEVARDHDLVIRIEEWRPVSLVVRHGGTGAPAPQAQAWIEANTRHRWLRPPHGVPDPQELDEGPFDADREGRIRLPLARGEHLVAVRAPGTAWSRLRVSSVVGQIPVDLVPGGSVHLRVENWKDLEDPSVFTERIERPSAAPVKEDRNEEQGGRNAATVVETGRSIDVTDPVPEPGEDGSVLVEGLECGVRRFEVRRGEHWWKGVAYGSADCEVLAGSTVEVVVPTTPSRAGSKAVLRGTFVVPEAWAVAQSGALLEVQIEPANPTSGEENQYPKLALEEGTREFRLQTAPIRTGEYRILVPECRWGARFRHDEGSDPHRWELPPPATLRVKALDAVSRDAIPEVRFSFQGNGGHFFLNPSRRSGDGEGGFPLLLAPGSWQVTCASGGYQDFVFRAEVAAGSEVSRTIHLRRAARVEVKLRLDGALWPGEAEFKILRSIDRGDGEDGERPDDPPSDDEDEVDVNLVSTSTTRSEGSADFDSLPPGKWVVRIGDVDGFEPLPPKTVTLERGQRLEVVFDLVRKK